MISSRRHIGHDVHDAGLRVATQRSIDDNGDGLVDEFTETRYLVDANNPTGFAQVLEETVLNDAEGELVAEVDDTQATQTRHEYDALGRQVAVISAQFDDPDDAEARVRLRTEYVYDARGNRIAVIDNVRQVGEHVDDSEARTTRYEYDEAGRLVAVILPAVAHPDTQQLVHPRYEYEYDVFGNQTVIRDNVAQGDPGDAGTIDASDSRETHFTFDAFGRQLSRTLPEGEMETFAYNDLGQRVLHIDFQGRVIESVYGNTPGAGGRLIEQRYFADETAYDDGNSTPGRTVAHTHDAFGRTIEIDDSGSGGAGVWTYNHDADGRLIAETDGNGHTVHYEYNNLGDHTATFTDHTRTEFTYDQLGRLETVTLTERQGSTLATPETTTYAYDLVGSLDLVEHSTSGGGMFSDYEYDELNRLVLLTHYTLDGGTPETLASFDYTLNLDGSRASVEQVFTADFVGEPQDLVTLIEWEYDAANRLVQESYTALYDPSIDFVTTYTYDLVGNRIEMATTSDGTTDVTTYIHDDNDRLLEELLDEGDNQTIDQTTLYAYEADEQVLKQVWDGDDTDPQTGTLVSETTYHYDLRGRMSKVEIDADGDAQINTVTEYLYNPNGIRVKQAVTENPGTAEEEVTVHEYVIASRNHTGYAQVLEEWIDGQLVNTFTIGHTILAQHDPENGTLTFLVDGHNSTMALVNTALELVQRYAYDAYGVQLAGADLTAAADALVSHLYAGEQFDAKTGMQYLRARYYDPATGTFNRLDPWSGNTQDPQSLHKYLYAHANPVMGVDPTGQFFSYVGQLVVTGLQASARAMKHAPAAKTKWETTRFISALSIGGNAAATAFALGPNGPVLTPNRPDALIFGWSFAGGFTISGGFGIDVLIFPHEPTVAHVYTQWTLSAGAVGPSLGTGLTVGAVWGVPTYADYEGRGFSVTSSWGGRAQSFLPLPSNTGLNLPANTTSLSVFTDFPGLDTVGFTIGRGLTSMSSGFGYTVNVSEASYVGSFQLPLASWVESLPWTTDVASIYRFLDSYESDIYNTIRSIV